MILLSQLIDHYQKDLERTHGHEMLPSHHQALRAMKRCRREGSDHMILECKPCATKFRVPHSCGHRSCPHCQHHDSQQWITRQSAKLLPVTYFMITFTVPAQLLHTHNRKLEYHPHVHMIVPAGVVDKKTGHWRYKAEKYLFPALNLAKVFRAKIFAGIKALGLKAKKTLPEEWVVHCKAVGRGDQALIYLGRYLYRGVISEKNILSDCQGIISFRIKDNTGQEVIQRLAGAEFLWRLLLHVLPKRFRRVRDFGLLHGNAKRLILLVQLVLRVRMPWPAPPREHTPMVCPRCGGVLQLLMVRQRERMPILC